MSSIIKYVERKDLDDDKWNSCIGKAHNGLLYAKTYYLDALAQAWSAVVVNDYEAVMPVTYKTKYTISYVCMPPFVQQLGIFCTQGISMELYEQMLELAKQKFTFGDYHFNYKNAPLAFLPKNNFILPLNQPYTFLKKNYKTDLKNNLAKAAQNGLHYATTADAGLAINTFRSLYGNRLNIRDMAYQNMQMLSKVLLQKNELLIREVRNTAGDLLSIAMCLRDSKRIYFLLSATSPQGRTWKANHYLIDRLVSEFSEQDMLLDFEGSDIEGIAHFYKNFGAHNQPYYFHHWNNLPWPLNMLKKSGVTSHTPETPRPAFQNPFG